MSGGAADNRNRAAGRTLRSIESRRGQVPRADQGVHRRAGIGELRRPRHGICERTAGRLLDEQLLPRGRNPADYVVGVDLAVLDDPAGRAIQYPEPMCRSCGEPLTGRQRVWCSEACRKRAGRQVKHPLQARHQAPHCTQEGRTPDRAQARSG